jgi:type III secretory pathway component EscU
LAAAGSGLAEAACAFGASAADGPVPSVSQAASASAAASIARLAAARIVPIVEAETVIKAFQGEVF